MKKAINMNAKYTLLAGATLCAAVMFSTGLAAHTTVVKKRAPDGDGGFSYQASEPDGAKSVLNTFAIPHGCKPGYLPIVASAVLFPNGENVVIEDQDGYWVDPEFLNDVLEGPTPLVIGPRPAQEAEWKFQDVRSGPVLRHNNHGWKTTDVRAFIYEGGNLPNGYMGLLRWRATFAKIEDDSCVKEIVLRIPIVNYCTRHPSAADRMDDWIGRPTPVFDDPQASPGWWPQMSIVNTGYSGIDEFGDSCGEGIVLKVSPSDEDIDSFLPIDSFKP